MSGSGADGKNPNNVLGGYKATINNPKVSEEAKDHARDMISQMGPEVDSDPNADYVDSGSADEEDDHFEADTTQSDDGVGQSKSLKFRRGLAAAGTVDDSSVGEKKNRNNVLGGYKATLKNPNVGEDAKKHAEEVLKAEGEM